MEVAVYRNVFIRQFSQSIRCVNTNAVFPLDRCRLHHGIQILSRGQLVDAVDSLEDAPFTLRLDSTFAARSRCAEEVDVQLVVEGVQRVELAHKSPHARCAASQEPLQSSVVRLRVAVCRGDTIKDPLVD
jgi:hypothetical protein